MRDTKNTLFLGIQIHQYHADMWLWEKFLASHEINSFIELGTGSGGLSIYLKLLGLHYGFTFDTWDIVIPTTVSEPVWTLLDMDTSFHIGDILYGSKPHVVSMIASCKPTRMLYCDNGDKPAEVKEFSQELSVGDFVAVHDWGTEFNQEDIPSSLEEIFIEESQVIGSRTHWMRKKI